jgi:hypothetical protein
VRRPFTSSFSAFSNVPLDKLHSVVELFRGRTGDSKELHRHKNYPRKCRRLGLETVADQRGISSGSVPRTTYDGFAGDSDSDGMPTSSLVAPYEAIAAAGNNDEARSQQPGIEALSAADTGWPSPQWRQVSPVPVKLANDEARELFNCKTIRRQRPILLLFLTFSLRLDARVPKILPYS